MLRERRLSEVHSEGGGELPVSHEEEDGRVGQTGDSACFHLRPGELLPRRRHPLSHHRLAEETHSDL